MSEKNLGSLPDFGAVFDLQQSLIAGWLKHRLDDFQAGLDAARRLAESRDPKAVTEIYQEWATAQFQRLQDEASALPEQFNSLGDKLTTSLWRPTESLPAEHKFITGRDRIGEKRAA